MFSTAPACFATQQPIPINLIMDAMKDELHDRAKYGKMMEMTDDDKVRRQIEFAYDDEGKHYRMFRQMMRCLTGTAPEISVPEIERYGSLKDAVESSIDGELEAVELYRRIRSSLPTPGLRDMMYEIITDEQEHATRFVYVYSILQG